MRKSKRSLEADPTTTQRLMNTISSNVLWLMNSKNLQQREIAEAIHISTASFSQRLRGVSKWTLDDVLYLSLFFGVPMSYMLANNFVVVQPNDFASAYQEQQTRVKTMAMQENNRNTNYQPAHFVQVDNSDSQELTGSAGPRFIIHPNDGPDDMKKRGGNPAPRAIVRPDDPDFWVPSVGLEPTLRRF